MQVRLALIGVGALAAAVAAVWWFTSDKEAAPASAPSANEAAPAAATPDQAKAETSQNAVAAQQPRRPKPPEIRTLEVDGEQLEYTEMRYDPPVRFEPVERGQADPKTAEGRLTAVTSCRRRVRGR